ncbi:MULTISPECIES: ribonuclease HII [unclassified Schaalia]|uniref:ribonuclease HII n=1 Tax=unclassified Schaalia TaxID=2691889 RepID=UPI001E4FBCCC|nr:MULTISPECIES: ribonuclease HII [unclassified Schaalia]MCD4549311.1 ribonuclease HII [Schaalia sp. lx-260]MCD4557120.1 ribonuclease HII [Schaalia sp. lx-100]
MRYETTREYEIELASRYGGLVAGIDEVGRGALAGPVAVGVTLVGAAQRQAPVGLTDSKLLTPQKRHALIEPIREWVVDAAIGWSSAQEIDQWGIIAALRCAAQRALAELENRGYRPSVIILDGSHDWLSQPSKDLLSQYDEEREPVFYDVTMPVKTRVKADATCSVVAAASVLAKVSRDQMMAELPDYGYGWASNKGYSSAAHIAALREKGASPWHRRSWKLPM